MKLEFEENNETPIKAIRNAGISAKLNDYTRQEI